MIRCDKLIIHYLPVDTLKGNGMEVYNIVKFKGGSEKIYLSLKCG